ncbi:YwqI/YxiC family protein [Halobacillus shinanisalinarum]|uniref:YwqI/YxiC family protein n=1 Tax=Halobacillus shinanisalinarum TaxID=2932258 RepID=A0ABY4H2M6_9BACI|nr:YwqI/YxiC family protein [Halobacillus shinanisalinarum]UOQ94564.1 YwqI/YxiC family protein [Halobacillus shinanisalinarum]
MSHEIKIRSSEVEQALSNLQTTVQVLQALLIKDMAAENQLETADQINELNADLVQLIENYKALLLKNEKETKKSVEAMFKADELLAGPMKR